MAERLTVAVAFSGQLRTFAENHSALLRMFSEAAGEGAEIRIFGALHAADLHQGAQFPWHAVEFLQMPLPPGRWREIALKYPAKSGDIVRAAREQWQGLLAAGRMVRAWERERSRRFDWVVRCRPDLAVVEPMEPLASLDPARCYFPRHNNWNGLNDRFAFGPSLLMQQYFAYPAHLAEFYLPSSTRPKLGCEHALAWHLANERVPIARTRAVLQPRREGGVIDPPVYRADRGDIPAEVIA